MTDLSRRSLFGLAAAAAIAPSLPKVEDSPFRAVKIQWRRTDVGGPPQHVNCRCEIRPFVSDQLAFGSTGR